jgi:hypothetical protein
VIRDIRHEVGGYMELSFNVFDVWVFRRAPHGVEYLLLHTSQEKADRYFNGGRFWQIPSNLIEGSDSVVGAIEKCLKEFGIAASTIWAAEHAYTIYNRRFDSIQIITVYAAEVTPGPIQLDPTEHSEFVWCSFEQAMGKVHYRGLKDGLRSVFEYITGVGTPARELRLR